MLACNAVISNHNWQFSWTNKAPVILGLLSSVTGLGIRISQPSAIWTSQCQFDTWINTLTKGSYESSSATGRAAVRTVSEVFKFRPDLPHASPATPGSGVIVERVQTELSGSQTNEKRAGFTSWHNLDKRSWSLNHYRWPMLSPFKIGIVHNCQNSLLIFQWFYWRGSDGVRISFLIVSPWTKIENMTTM